MCPKIAIISPSPFFYLIVMGIENEFGQDVNNNGWLKFVGQPLYSSLVISEIHDLIQIICK